MSTDERKDLPEEILHDDLGLFLKECKLAGIKIVCCWYEEGRPNESYTEIILNRQSGWVHLLDNNDDEGVIATYIPTGGCRKALNPLWKRVDHRVVYRRGSEEAR